MLIWLGVVLAVIAVVIIGAAITHQQGCFIASRGSQPRPPWYTIYLARPMLVVAPATVFFVVGFATLGARRVPLRLLGLLLAGLAAFGAWWVVAGAMLPCF